MASAPEPSSETDTIPRELLAGAPSIESRRKRFDEARQMTSEARNRSQIDRDYYDGPKQLNSKVREILESRRQPPIYTNRVRPAVNGVLGILEASRSDPRAYPRNPDDQQSSDVCTKTLRYIADECKFAETKQDVAETFLIEGTGAVIIEMDDDRIDVQQIRWEEFYWDAYARRNDFCDARYMGIAKWMDAAQVRERWRDRIGEIGDPMAGRGWFGLGGGYDDKPDGQGWTDKTRQRVLVVEEYAIEQGQWMRIVYIATGVLEYGPSPYLDEKRRPCNPIEAVSCYVASGTSADLQRMAPNERYGTVRDMVPLQDEINASRSRSLHLMNSRQVQRVDENAPPIDSMTARTEAARADGVLPPGYQIVPTSDMTQANMVRNQEAKAEIERMGPTPAVLGRADGANQSGRSRQVLQQAGMTEIARPIARLRDWELRVYKQMWNRAKQFKTAPWWVRVTDQIEAPDFLQVNEPVMGMVMQPAAGPDGQPVVDPMTGQPAMQPGVGQVGVKNRLAEMDMDIIIDTTPDTAALQQEVFTELLNLIQSGVSPFSPEFELLLEMSPLSDKARILERLKAKREEQQQAQAEQAAAAQQQMQLDQAEQQAKIENTQAKTAQTETDTMVTAFRAGHQTAPDREPDQSSYATQER